MPFSFCFYFHLHLRKSQAYFLAYLICNFLVLQTLGFVVHSSAFINVYFFNFPAGFS